MKIVLTGATGLVGEALGQRLVREGFEVVALTRPGSRRPSHYPCAIFEWDSLRTAAPREALLGADVVIHLAGENISSGRWTKARKKALRDSRVLSAENLRLGLDQADVKPKVFISASGVGVYGDRADSELTEAAPVGDDFLASLCQEWEAAADLIKADRTVKARFGVVLSLEGGFLREVAPLFSMLGASRLGSGRQWFSWIHMEDLIEGLLFAIREPKLQGAVNMVAPSPLLNSDLTQDLAHALKTFRAPAVPGFALKLLYGELTQALLGSQRTIPEKLMNLGFQWKYPTFKKAMDAIYHDLRAGEMKLVFAQWVAASGQQVWPFFSSEKNLERLTPPFLNFHVVGKSTEQIEQGTMIDYRLKMHGLPMRWRSEITQWTPEISFVDEQRKGPYKTWRHLHEFIPLGSGTLLQDTIRLKPPMGWAGRAAALKLIINEVETIFAYRAKITSEIFLA